MNLYDSRLPEIDLQGVLDKKNVGDVQYRTHVSHVGCVLKILWRS